MGIRTKKRKDGTTAWYYDFTINGVRYREVGGASRTQALRAQEKKRSEVLDETHGLAYKIGNPKIELFAITYLDRRKHLRFHKRDALSVRNILQYFKGNNLMSINTSDIEDFIVKRREDGVMNGTINRELTCLKRMFNLAIKWGETRKNPVQQIDMLEEPPGRTRFLSIEDAQKLIQFSCEHIKPIVILALNTGMRLNEVLSLKWKQIYLDDVIDPHIELTYTKNNRKRFIPLNDDIVKLFLSYRQKSIPKQKNPEFVFCSVRTGYPLKSVRKPFERALKMAGIEDFRFHDLRHTFASHYVMNGGDLLSLRDILGHSNLKMVERYTHLGSAYKRKMINNLNGKFSECHLYVTSEEKTQKYIKREIPQHVNITGFTDVSQEGVEPTTNGLKGRCSTN